MQKRFTLYAVLVASSLIASHACAQAVQLPTFRYFSVQTTVSVPDRGGALLGGVDRASSGSTSRGFGPLRNRASGSSVGSSIASVHATIIDHNELDQAVLAEARRRRGDTPLMLRNRGERDVSVSRSDDPLLRKADQLSRNVAAREVERPRAAQEEPVESLAEIRARAASRADAKQAEAAAKFAAGLASQEAGKFASARGYFEAAARLGDEELRQQALERLATIALPTPTKQRVADK